MYIQSNRSTIAKLKYFAKRGEIFNGGVDYPASEIDAPLLRRVAGMMVSVF